MKHKLFLFILFVILIGFYYNNCIEKMTNSEEDDSKNKVIKLINESIKKNLQNIYSSFINDIIDEKLKDIKCQRGPPGPKGDVGDKATSYQGLYCEDDLSYPISFPNINENAINIENNIVVLKSDMDDNAKKDNSRDFFILSNKERWQYTDSKEIKSAYKLNTDNKSNYGICYNNNNDVFMCNDVTDGINTTFNYNNDNMLKTTNNKCLTLSDMNYNEEKDENLKQYSKKLTLSDCDKKNKKQKFFFH